MTTVESGLAFQLPDALVAHEPPEARGLARDGVRLLVSRGPNAEITHARFSRLSDFLDAGDVLVVNTSATINAALVAVREARGGGTSDVMLHLSTPLEDQQWVVEVRRRGPNGTSPLLDADSGEFLRFPAGGTARLVEPYSPGMTHAAAGRVRLWIATLTLPGDPLAYTARHGSPIRYAYVPKSWPLSYYQTVFAGEPGSAEMPSAGRAFTRQMVAGLTQKGIRIAPLVLHTGVSSLEAGEPPYPERYAVSAATADVVNDARANGGRIVAVGTTVVRALETVASIDGRVRAGHGWTDLVITPERGLRTVNAMLTGLHEPRASHVSMLEALAGHVHVAAAYEAAVSHGYLWHEFGDLHLIL